MFPLQPLAYGVPAMSHSLVDMLKWPVDNLMLNRSQNKCDCVYMLNFEGHTERMAGCALAGFKRPFVTISVHEE